MTAPGSSRTPLLVFSSILLAGGLTFFVFTLPALRGKADRRQQSATVVPPAPEATGATIPTAGTPDRAPPPVPPPVRLRDPAAVLEAVAQGLLAGDAESLLRILGPEVVTTGKLEAARRLLGPDGFEVDPANAVGEIGRTPTLQRWAINLRKRGNPETKSRLELDFARQADESWKPSRLHLPGEENPQGFVADAEALTTAQSFVEAVERQDFPAARRLVDHNDVSDATIAGLCIIFEEGGFALRKDKPLVATVAKPNVAWFLAQMVSDQLQTESSFGLVLQREQGDPWLIKQVNLDRILSVYAKRLGEGDINYTPLVRNPQGGDSVVLYFEFDSERILPRTLRQVEIVAAVLKADPGRKLRIWGHTDAKGTTDYNKNLSEHRAWAVRDAIIGFGVATDQVNVEGFGASRPRQANFNPDGSDNPDGRKVNRRAEVYLDF